MIIRRRLYLKAHRTFLFYLHFLRDVSLIYGIKVDDDYEYLIPLNNKICNGLDALNKRYNLGIVLKTKDDYKKFIYEYSKKYDVDFRLVTIGLHFFHY